MFPGMQGGVSWGGTAYDPDLGYIFVNSKERPMNGSSSAVSREMLRVTSVALSDSLVIGTGCLFRNLQSTASLPPRGARTASSAKSIAQSRNG